MICEVQEDISIQNQDLFAHDIMLATATRLSSFYFHVSDISEDMTFDLFLSYILFSSVYLMVLCGLLCFLYLKFQLVASTGDNDENIWMSKFCDISHDEILEGTRFLLQTAFIKK